MNLQALCVAGMVVDQVHRQRAKKEQRTNLTTKTHPKIVQNPKDGYGFAILVG